MKAIFIVLSLLICLNLSAEINFELLFYTVNPSIDDVLKNIWIDDLDNDGIDEFYTLFVNYDDDNWKIRCHSLIGTILWEYTFEHPGNSIPFKNGQLFRYNDVVYFAEISVRTEEVVPYPDMLDVYSDLNLYTWENLVLVDSQSVLIGTSSEENSFGFDVNQINILEVNDTLNLIIGEVITHAWGNWNQGVHLSFTNKTFRFSLNNNMLTFNESIDHTGTNLQFYNDFESLVSFCNNRWHYSDNQGNSSMGTSEYLKVLSLDIPTQITDVYSSTNGYLQPLTTNDLNYLDYGLTVLVSEDNSNFRFQCYSPEFSDTLWTSNQLGIFEEGYNLTSSTCVSTNLGDNYILSFGRDDAQPNFPMVQLINRMNGQIVLTQSTNIHPVYILRGSDNSLYFIEGGSDFYDPLYYNIYTLDDEIQVSSDDNSFMTQDNFSLYNHPNPFNSSTTIRFTLLYDSEIQLEIYNIKGQKVKTLISGFTEHGYQSIDWNGEDEAGNTVSSGLYFYKLKVNNKTEIVNKCILLK